MSNINSKIGEQNLIRNFRVNPNVFYLYYVLTNSKEPNFEKLVTNLKTLNELVGYRSRFGTKFTEDHKYNLTKNVFWNKCGFNEWLKSEIK